jgi:transposase
MSKSIFTATFAGAQELKNKVNEARYVIGLDVHKKTTAVTIMENNEKIFQRKRLANMEVLSVLKKYEGKKVIGMEGAYGWKMVNNTFQNEPDITFTLLNPRKTSGWAQATGVKSDKIDSEVLAHALLHGIESLSVYIPSKEAQENMKLVQHRDSLVRERTKVINQLKSLQRDYETNPYTGEVYEKTETIKFIENNFLDEINFVNEKIKKTEERMSKITEKDKVVEILQTIPGIGFVTSFALRWKIDDINRFENASHLSSYLGLAIRQSQSGGTSHKGKIMKTGSKLVRGLLTQCAQGLLYRKIDDIQCYFPDMMLEEMNADIKQNKKERGKHKNKKVIAIARKTITFVYACWNNMKKFDLEWYKNMKEQLQQKMNEEQASLSNKKPFPKNKPLCIQSKKNDSKLLTSVSSMSI